MITIVDYGVGNIGALVNMFEYLGLDAHPESDPATIAQARRLVLPGVGAFDKAMSALRARDGLVDALNASVLHNRTPVLGVCLGMQLLARSSSEGQERGLGWIPGDVKRITVPIGSPLKVPHIGWSDVQALRPSPLFPEGEASRFYFVHGYHLVCDDPADMLATVDYAGPMCCAVHRDNIWGVQFHPEKSHTHGMRLLAAFAGLGSP